MNEIGNQPISTRRSEVSPVRKANEGLPYIDVDLFLPVSGVYPSISAVDASGTDGT